MVLSIYSITSVTTGLSYFCCGSDNGAAGGGIGVVCWCPIDGEPHTGIPVVDVQLYSQPQRIPIVGKRVPRDTRFVAGAIASIDLRA
ncbi:hypothetical protein YH64_014190 [Achromobacter sp. LC458]|uniref:hypothetical protein n=1 Tax=Achromobacter sp. LC458 TaxID=1120623 RepID=UPI00116A2173|nr:hypothetical protein [Achromobacter sp. LC458]TRM52409.1 hypothetical protein YH64_014190 [Achromobacter sp. LC458]